MSDRQASRLKSLYSEIRCPVCDGQSVEDSEATLAQDLRQIIQQMVLQQKTDGEIRHFLVQRYGDEILLRPQFSWDTAALWGVPLVLIVVALASILTKLFKGWALP